MIEEEAVYWTEIEDYWDKGVDNTMNSKPTKFPHIVTFDNGIDDNSFYMFVNETKYFFIPTIDPDNVREGWNPTHATKEEAQLYWRYVRAWKLMKR